MIVEEHGKALGMLHHLEGLEFYLSALKGRVKAIEPRKRGDMLVCIQAAERAHGLALSSLRELLLESDRIETERRGRLVLLLSQARAQGRVAALDLVAEAVADHRRAADEEISPETVRIKGISGNDHPADSAACLYRSFAATKR